jgi:hypothetical protein
MPDLAELILKAGKHLPGCPVLTTEELFLGHTCIRALRLACRVHGAGADELAAIDRFENFRASHTDIDHLAPLARLAGINLRALFTLLVFGVCS